MKRPVVIILVGYIIGIIWGLYLKNSIVPFILCMILIIICLSKIIKNKKYYKCLKIYFPKQVILTLIIFSVLSNFVVLFLNYKYEKLYQDIEKAEFIGTIVSGVEEKQYYNRYKIKIDSVNKDKKYNKTYLFFNINKEHDIGYEYGDLIKFEGEYISPNKARNENGFDYKEYLKSIKVYGTVKSESKNIKILKKKNCNYIGYTANFIRSNIKQRIYKILPNKLGNLILGILIGDIDSLDDKTIQNFRDSSLYHILAVSGSHVSYIILGISIINKKIKIEKRFGRLITDFILILFMFITGLTSSVMRACIMGILLISSRYFL